MRDVDTALRAITAASGAFLRREAIELGLEDRDLRRGVRRGQLVKVRHGAYVHIEDWSPLDEVARHVVLTRTALRTLGDRVAASHHSGAALFGMALWDVPLSVTHVTRMDGGAGRTEGDIVHHEGLMLGSDVERLGAVHVMRPVRSALESAALSGVERGLVTVNSGLHAGLFDEEELFAQQRLMQSWPSSRHLHLVTRLADRRAESVGESRALFLFWSQGLPRPELQLEIRDGGRIVGIVDFAWPEHELLVEFDGRVKYGRHLRPGEEPGDAVFREKRREDDLRRVTGWRVIRLTWADLAEPVRTATMLRAAMRQVA
jgi:hypothetical protein